MRQAFLRSETLRHIGSWLPLGGFVPALFIGAFIGVAQCFLCRMPMPQRQTIQDAKKIASAADMYVAEKPGCPNVKDLVDAKNLSTKTRVRDAWDHEFKIICRADRRIVLSAGPDGKYGTADDLNDGDASREREKSTLSSSEPPN